MFSIIIEKGLQKFNCLLFCLQTKQRKTNRGYTSGDVIMCAVKDVKINNISIRSAAKNHGINYRTLASYCKKIIITNPSHGSIADLIDKNENPTSLNVIGYKS